MRKLLDDCSSTIGAMADDLRDLAEKLTDDPAAQVRRAAELLDAADEALTALYFATATDRPLGKVSRTIPEVEPVNSTTPSPVAGKSPVTSPAPAGQLELWAVA